MKHKIFDVNNLLWLALILALAGSLKHLAAIFAGIDGNYFMGWLQAIAIDTGLFALAYSIRVRKVANRNVKPIWFGVVVFTGISVYGNLAYGLLHANETGLPFWLEFIKPIILSASLPVLVLFLSELLSDNVSFLDISRQLAEFKGKHIEKGGYSWRKLRRLIWERDYKNCLDCGVDLSGGSYHCHHVTPEMLGGKGEPDNLITLCKACHRQAHSAANISDKEREIKRSSAKKGGNSLKRKKTLNEKKAERQKKLLAIHEQNPAATITELAAALAVSRGTVRNYAGELGLELAGNGNGREK